MHIHTHTETDKHTHENRMYLRNLEHLERPPELRRAMQWLACRLHCIFNVWLPANRSLWNKQTKWDNSDQIVEYKNACSAFVQPGCALGCFYAFNIHIFMATPAQIRVWATDRWQSGPLILSVRRRLIEKQALTPTPTHTNRKCPVVQPKLPSDWGQPAKVHPRHQTPSSYSFFFYSEELQQHYHRKTTTTTVKINDIPVCSKFVFWSKWFTR